MHIHSHFRIAVFVQYMVNKQMHTREGGRMVLVYWYFSTNILNNNRQPWVGRGMRHPNTASQTTPVYPQITARINNLHKNLIFPNKTWIHICWRRIRKLTLGAHTNQVRIGISGHTQRGGNVEFLCTWFWNYFFFPTRYFLFTGLIAWFSLWCGSEDKKTRQTKHHMQRLFLSSTRFNIPTVFNL